MKNKTCTQLEELLLAEMPALQEAILHRMSLLEKETHMKVPYHMAEKDFMNRFLNAWAEGAKQIYCSRVCKDRDNCELGYNNLHHFTDYYRDKKDE